MHEKMMQHTEVKTCSPKFEEKNYWAQRIVCQNTSRFTINWSLAKLYGPEKMQFSDLKFIPTLIPTATVTQHKHTDAK